MASQQLDSDGSPKNEECPPFPRRRPLLEGEPHPRPLGGSHGKPTPYHTAAQCPTLPGDRGPPGGTTPQRCRRPRASLCSYTASLGHGPPLQRLGPLGVQGLEEELRGGGAAAVPPGPSSPGGSGTLPRERFHSPAIKMGKRPLCECQALAGLASAFQVPSRQVFVANANGIRAVKLHMTLQPFWTFELQGIPQNPR